MRAVRFVKRLEWELPGTVSRHGLTIGDVDNDGDNELVVGTAEGDVFIFKGTEIWQKITGLGLVSCVAVGDIFNYGCNALVVICADGWAHIFYSPRSVTIPSSTLAPINLPASLTGVTDNELYGKMECVHFQRIPTNTKVILIADVDRDGANEMIIGLTDRVVRSYRWSTNNNHLGTGKLVGLNKWECANQIGTVTLQHMSDGRPTLLVAQPGGTFMRIQCNPDIDNGCINSTGKNNEAADSCVDYQTLGISRMRNPNISTEIIGDLEPSSSLLNESDSRKSQFHDDIQSETTNGKFYSPEIDQVDGNVVGGNIILGNFETDIGNKKSHLPSYEDFSRNDNEKSDNKDESAVISDVVKWQKRIKDSDKGEGKPYALATLDGTIMLVKDEIILWAMQIDHQIFALCRLDVTGDGADEIVACTWDGQTYILDQQRRSVRFQFEEPVRAFTTGKYSVNSGTTTPCLVYNTFGNKIFLYHDVVLPSMVISPLNPLQGLEHSERKIVEESIASTVDSASNHQQQNFTEYLLYGLST